MDSKYFEHFAPVIRTLSASELEGAPSLFDKLQLEKRDDLAICYAPFEFVNEDARIVLVGITPGKQQMLNALREARHQLDLGRSDRDVLMAAKHVGGFSGEIRTHLVNLLDHIGIQHWLSISSCAELFGSSASLVQTASVLRNPVFFRRGDYNGTPKIVRNELLKEHLLSHFAKDIPALSKAVFIPLGKPVVDALAFLAEEGVLDPKRVLFGLPHPSPQNIERIKYFLGQKPRELLSVKTNPDKLDLARSEVIRQVQALA